MVAVGLISELSCGTVRQPMRNNGHPALQRDKLRQVGRVQEDETVRSEPASAGERPMICPWQIIADQERHGSIPHNTVEQNIFRPRSQVVRHGSAKPVFGGSIPPVASKKLQYTMRV